MTAPRTTVAAIEAHYLPRIAQARASAEERRDEAWLDAPLLICDLPVRAMTLRDYLALTAAGNAHVTPVPVPADPVAEVRFWGLHHFTLLWLLSPDYRPDAAARDAFVAAHANRLPFAQLEAGIADYLRHIFADRPPVPAASQGDQSAPDHVPATIAASFAAHWIHDFATAYGWRASETLSLPLPQIFQLLNLLRYDQEVESGKTPLPAGDEADVLAARAFAEIAALTA